MVQHFKQDISDASHKKCSCINRIFQSIPSLIFDSLLLLTVFILPSFGDTYVDHFENGIDTIYWMIQSNDTLYKVDDTHGDVRFSRSPGGTQVLNTIHLIFRPVVKGDFEVGVDFSNAYIDRINGSPGNQVQLNSGFGGQAFSDVRSDEAGFGHNYHVWIDPPRQWRGNQANTDTTGTLRITRVDSTVTGYFNSNLIFSDVFNDADVMHLSFSLQNNGTTDSTSVVFDNFSIVADTIVEIPTGIRSHNQKMTFFKLQQNFPNPFNPTTSIEFTLPHSEYVNLNVYNLLGEEIGTLVSDKLLSGTCKYEWDASDYPSGIYIYRLKAGEFVETKKMILLK